MVRGGEKDFIPPLKKVPLQGRGEVMPWTRESSLRANRAKMQKMTPEQRRKIARAAIRSRWAKTTPAERRAFGFRLAAIRGYVIRQKKLRQQRRARRAS
jgi:hypothetical protein